jgi:Mg2+ and Co2+ transporter CorA
MSRANVKSIEAIRDFRVALIKFAEKITDAVESMKDQVFHAVSWVELEQPRHWHQQELTAYDRVSEARIQLEVSKMRKETADFRPSLIEEKQALRAARRRLEYCRQNVQLVKTAAFKVRHEADEFQGRLGQVDRLLETDLPNMIAMLERMVSSLEAYAEVSTKDVDK